MHLYSILVFLHIAFGVVVLVAFWAAALARKGSALHRGAGRVFHLGIAAVLLSAAPLALRLLLAGHVGFAVFLLYLLLISGLAWWQLRRSIRLKATPAAYYNGAFRAQAIVLVASGAALLVFAALRGQPVFAAFALVGLFGGRSDWQRAQAAPAPRWWLREHVGAMLGLGVATHIAFLSLGLRQLWPQYSAAAPGWLAWLLPLAVALAAQLWIERRWLRPTGPRAASGSPATALPSGHG